MSYTKKQISDITGLSLRLVQFYTEEGLVLPEENSGKGRGNIRQYSVKSLRDFLIIKELSNFGITKAKMTVFLKYIRDAKSDKVVIGAENSFSFLTINYSQITEVMKWKRLTEK